MKYDSLILKKNLSHCEGSQKHKIVFHVLEASVMQRSNQFVREQQQTEERIRDSIILKMTFLFENIAKGTTDPRVEFILPT